MGVFSGNVVELRFSAFYRVGARTPSGLMSFNSEESTAGFGSAPKHRSKVPREGSSGRVREAG
jgi:hypothetical protein